MSKVYVSNPAQLETAPTGPGTTTIICSKIDTSLMVCYGRKLESLRYNMLLSNLRSTMYGVRFEGKDAVYFEVFGGHGAGSF